MKDCKKVNQRHWFDGVSCRRVGVFTAFGCREPPSPQPAESSLQQVHSPIRNVNMALAQADAIFFFLSRSMRIEKAFSVKRIAAGKVFVRAELEMALFQMLPDEMKKNT